MSLGETTRSGLLVGWPENAEHRSLCGDRPVTYAPDVAGLAALLGSQRPSDPLVWADRGSGSLAVCLTHANGAILRATRESATDHGGWLTRVNRVVAETALSVGHTGPFVEGVVASLNATLPDDDGAVAMLPPETIDAARLRLGGLDRDGNWWARYGIAAGVLLAASDPELAPLTRLEQDPPIERPSRIRDAANKLSKPRAATVTVIVCLLVLMLAPLLFSGLRLVALKARFPEIEQQKLAVDRANRQVAMYRSLEKQSWPMTKLLSDIVSNTPETIQLETLRVSHADSSFHITGEARPDRDANLSAPEVITLMQENLKQCGIFSEVNPNWEDAGIMTGFVFDMVAKIDRPYRRFRYPVELDYDKWPLQRRRAKLGPIEDEEPDTALADADAGDGEAADDESADPVRVATGGDTDSTPARSGSANRSGSNAGSGSGRSPSRPRPTRTIGGGGDGDAGNRSDTGDRVKGGVPESMSVPEALSKEQIDAMSIDEARSHLSELATARQFARRSNDEELQARLKQEWNWIKERLAKDE
jgi:hypothetical protein